MNKKLLRLGLSLALLILGISAFVFAFNSKGGQEEAITPVFADSSLSESDNSDIVPVYTIDDAPDHIGERSIVKGKVIEARTTKSGVTFFDFCEDYSKCPFSAVIFKSELSKFKDIKQYQREVSISGVIRSYKGKAEIIIDDPEQIK